MLSLQTLCLYIDFYIILVLPSTYTHISPHIYANVDSECKKAKHKLFWILAITLLDDYMKIRLSDKGSLINRGKKMFSLPALKVEFLPTVVINTNTFISSSPNGCEDDSVRIL